METNYSAAFAVIFTLVAVLLMLGGVVVTGRLALPHIKANRALYGAFALGTLAMLIVGRRYVDPTADGLPMVQAGRWLIGAALAGAVVYALPAMALVVRGTFAAMRLRLRAKSKEEAEQGYLAAQYEQVLSSIASMVKDGQVGNESARSDRLSVALFFHALTEQKVTTLASYLNLRTCEGKGDVRAIAQFLREERDLICEDGTQARGHLLRLNREVHRMVNRAG